LAAPSSARSFAIASSQAVQIRENPLLERCRETLDAFGCAIFTMRYENVELAKVSINFCLDPGLGIARGNIGDSNRSNVTELSESIDAGWAEIARRATTANQGNAEDWTTGGRLQGGHPVNEELGRPCLLA